MNVHQLKAELVGWLERVDGDREARILVRHPETGELMLFDIEGVDAWEGPSGLTVMVQNFPAEMAPHLKLVPSG